MNNQKLTEERLDILKENKTIIKQLGSKNL